MEEKIFFMSKQAERLKRLRELAGMSQYALAKAAALDRSVLSTIENGHVAASPEQVRRIEEACRKASVDRVEQARKLAMRVEELAPAV